MYKEGGTANTMPPRAFTTPKITAARSHGLRLDLLMGGLTPKCDRSFLEASTYSCFAATS